MKQWINTNENYVI